MITGVILAGGEGKRIGGDKPARRLCGRPMIEWAIDSLQQVVSSIVVAVAPDQVLPQVRVRVPLIVCEDLLPGRGPMTGVYTGLTTSGADGVLAVPCDAPFITPAVLQLLLDQRHGYDAAIPRVAGRLQPAIAVYNRTMLPLLIDALNRDDFSLGHLLARVNARIVPDAAVREVDPCLRSFFNVNSVADLGRAESMVAAQAAGG